MPHIFTLTDDVVLRIAKLANLTLSPDAIKTFRTQLSQTIEYVQNLDELDTGTVKPTSHSTNVTNMYFTDGIQNARGLTQQQATQNAKKLKKRMFVVKRVIE